MSSPTSSCNTKFYSSLVYFSFDFSQQFFSSQLYCIYLFCVIGIFIQNSLDLLLSKYFRCISWIRKAHLSLVFVSVFLFYREKKRRGNLFFFSSFVLSLFVHCSNCVYFIVTKKLLYLNVIYKIMGALSRGIFIRIRDQFKCGYNVSNFFFFVVGNVVSSDFSKFMQICRLIFIFLFR